MEITCEFQNFVCVISEIRDASLLVSFQKRDSLKMYLAVPIGYHHHKDIYGLWVNEHHVKVLS